MTVWIELGSHNAFFFNFYLILGLLMGKPGLIRTYLDCLLDVPLIPDKPFQQGDESHSTFGSIYQSICCTCVAVLQRSQPW